MGSFAKPVPDRSVHARLFALDPGMYILRYARPAREARETPSEIHAVVGAAPRQDGAEVRFLAGSNVEEGVLAAPGDCIVIRIRHRRAILVTTIYGSADQTKPDIRLRIDKIDETGDEREQPRPSQKGHTVASKATSDVPSVQRLPDGAQPLWILAHIDGAGDVQGAPGAWVGDPYGSKRLEGFSLHWDTAPAGVDIRYTCVVEGMGRTPAAATGQFVGTRGRDAAIKSVTMTLIGERSDAWRLAAQAAFSRSGPSSPCGSGAEMRGRTENEYLTALRVILVPVKIAT